VVVVVLPSWVATIVVVVLLPLPLALVDPDDEAVGIVVLTMVVEWVVEGDVTGAELLETVVVPDTVEAIFEEGAG
jgi:hypothetical protein